jgi:phosphoribosylanthranilate isomerase
MPGGPGIISDEVIAAVAAEVPPLVDSFLTTCAQNAATVIDQQRRSKTSALSAL